MSEIFISYRRNDSSGFAGRIFDRLCREFGASAVFRDLDAIQSGTRFPRSLQRNSRIAGFSFSLSAPAGSVLRAKVVDVVSTTLMIGCALKLTPR